MKPPRSRPVCLNLEPSSFSVEAAKIIAKGYDLIDFVSFDILDDTTRHKTEALFLRLGFALDESIYNLFPNLRFIACPATGTEHIDLAGLEKRKIQLISLKGDHDFLMQISATAELSFALILTGTRAVSKAYDHVLQGKWDRDQFQGSQLKGKTLGILGFGRLGGMVSRYANAFNMEVIAHDIKPRAKNEVKFVSIADLFHLSDYLSIHVPLDSTTQGIVNTALLRQARPNLKIINTSRGGVVNEVDIVQALREKRISGYYTDVLEGEETKSSNFPMDNPIWKEALNDNRILITPHIGGKTLESNKLAEIRIAEKLVKLTTSI